MKPAKASLINAILLISLSLWGYFSSETPSVTALIPTIIGVILLACNKGIKTKNKVIAHVAVLLTLLIIIGLIKPLMGAYGRADSMAITRVWIMFISSVIALVAFIKNFIDAKKEKEA